MMAMKSTPGNKGLENVDVLLLEIPGGGRWVGKTERTKRLRVSKPGV